MKLFRRLFPKLNKLERSIASVIEGSLSGENRKIFEDQISRINSVRRDPEGTEVNFHWVRFGKVCRDYPKKFNVPDGEHVLATMNVYYYGRTVPVVVWLIDRHIFGYEYKRSLETVEPRDNYTVSDVEIYI